MNTCILCGEPSGNYNTCCDCGDQCRKCGVPATGDDLLCEDCRHERDEDLAQHGWYVSDSGEILDIEPCEDDGGEYDWSGWYPTPDEQSEETQPTPVEEQCQAWIEVDGQRVTPDDVRRLANLYQQTRWAWILSGIAENKAQQIIRRLEEVELADCGYTEICSVTPKGYELLRNMAV